MHPNRRPGRRADGACLPFRPVTCACDAYARPYGPWPNGKAGRTNQTPAREWQNAGAWESEASRASALEAFVDRYNWDRLRSACGGLPPMWRMVGVNDVLARIS